MSEAQDQDNQPKNVEVESIRFMARDGGKSGYLSVVVGGVHYVWTCSRERMLIAGETLFSALRKQDAS